MRPTKAAGAGGLAALDREPIARAHPPDQSRSREARARRVRGLVACVLFLALLGGSWLIGSKSAVAPPGEETRTVHGADGGQTPSAMQGARFAPGGERTAGLIVYELADGLSCTYVPFDNVTTWMGEPATALCEDAARKQREGNRREFSWGSR